MSCRQRHHLRAPEVQKRVAATKARQRALNQVPKAASKSPRRWHENDYLGPRLRAASGNSSDWRLGIRVVRVEQHTDGLIGTKSRRAPIVSGQLGVEQLTPVTFPPGR